jgi:hypothetical protein
MFNSSDSSDSIIFPMLLITSSAFFIPSISASFKPISLCLDSNTEEDLIKNETKKWLQK